MKHRTDRTLIFSGRMDERFMKLVSLKAKFRALKTDKNEIKTFNITAMSFNFVFL